MVLDNDGIAFKTTKDKVKSLALKAKVNREQTIGDSDSQGESDEDVDEEEEAEVFNLMAKNFRKFFRKGNQFERGNRFGNCTNMFRRGRGNSFGNKGGESSKQKGACYNYGIEGHFASECRKPKENKVFTRGACSDSEDNDEPQNDATCLMEIVTQEFDLKLYKDVFLGYSQNSKAYIVLNMEIMRIKESLNVTFDESFPEPKSSSSVENDWIIEPIVQNPVMSLSLKANPLEPGYPKNIKEARGYTIEHVIGELDDRTLRSKTKQA
ncbi:retrovirus-related pol polyprotein from transposon TNT 1-94 [Tanacetum coccineum]